MSAQTAQTAQATRAAERRRSPSVPSPRSGRAATPLLLVPPVQRHAARTPFALLVLGLLAAGLVGLLLLNTFLAQDAFRLHDLQRRGVALTEREQVLNRSVNDLAAPGALAARARALGMGPASDPLFLRLADGAVIGGTGGPPKPTPKPVAVPAAAPAPAAPPAPSPAPSVAVSVLVQTAPPAPGGQPKPPATRSTPGPGPVAGASPAPRPPGTR